MPKEGSVLTTPSHRFWVSKSAGHSISVATPLAQSVMRKTFLIVSQTFDDHNRHLGIRDRENSEARRDISFSMAVGFRLLRRDNVPSSLSFKLDKSSLCLPVRSTWTLFFHPQQEQCFDLYSFFWSWSPHPSLTHSLNHFLSLIFVLGLAKAMCSGNNTTNMRDVASSTPPPAPTTTLQPAAMPQPGPSILSILPSVPLRPTRCPFSIEETQRMWYYSFNHSPPAAAASPSSPDSSLYDPGEPVSPRTAVPAYPAVSPISQDLAEAIDEDPYLYRSSRWQVPMPYSTTRAAQAAISWQIPTNPYLCRLGLLYQQQQQQPQAFRPPPPPPPTPKANVWPPIDIAPNTSPPSPVLQPQWTNACPPGLSTPYPQTAPGMSFGYGAADPFIGSYGFPPPGPWPPYLPPPRYEGNVGSSSEIGRDASGTMRREHEREVGGDTNSKCQRPSEEPGVQQEEAAVQGDEVRCSTGRSPYQVLEHGYCGP